MRSVLSVRRWALSAAVAVVVALVGAAGAMAAGGPPVWAPATLYTGVSGTQIATFSSVSCVSPGDCVAVGYHESSTGPVESFVAVERAGTWGPKTTVTASDLPPDASSTPNDELASVSCASAGSCEAVGFYQNSSGDTAALVLPITVSGQTATLGQGVTVSLPAGVSSSDAMLNGVSCQGSGGCVAVGQYTDASGQHGVTATPASGGGWSATALTQLPSNANSSSSLVTLNSVSCPSSGACEAVGTYLDDSTPTAFQQPLAVTVSGGNAGQAVQVSLPSDYDPTAPGSIVLFVNLGTTLSSVSCSSAEACTAAGSYTTTPATSGGGSPLSAVAVPITGGTPGTPVELQLPASASSASGGPSGGSVASISCTDADDCSVVGYSIGASAGPPEVTPVTGAQVGGTWSALTTLPFSSSAATSTSGTFAGASGVSCAAVGRCEAVGTFLSPLSPTPGATPFTAASVPQLTMTTSSLPAAQVGKAYSATLQAAGGTGDNAWSIGLGSLPAGLSLNASTGVISGTPTAGGQSGFIALDTDAGPPSQNASAALSITVSAAAPAPRVASVKVLYLKTSGNKATVVLSCSGAPCNGSLSVVGVERRTGKRVTGVVASTSTKHRITLAGGGYSIAGDSGKTVTLKLSGKANRLRKRLHRVSGYLNVTPTGTTRPAVIKKATFRAANKHAKHHHKHHKHK